MGRSRLAKKISPVSSANQTTWAFFHLWYGYESKLWTPNVVIYNGNLLWTNGFFGYPILTHSHITGSMDHFVECFYGYPSNVNVGLYLWIGINMMITQPFWSQMKCSRLSWNLLFNLSPSLHPYRHVDIILFCLVVVVFVDASCFVVDVFWQAYVWHDAIWCERFMIVHEMMRNPCGLYGVVHKWCTLLYSWFVFPTKMTSQGDKPI